jgi:hypothetical protein
MALPSLSRRSLLQALSSGAAWALLPLRASGGSQQSQDGPNPLELRRLGKTDLQVRVLGFGSAEIGFEQTDQATVDKLLNSALDTGLNVIDTAECYLDAEVAIGNAVAHRRKDFFLFTKCGHSADDWVNGSDWSKAGVLRSVERSLKRLKTDAVDLLMIHSSPLAELEQGDGIEGLEQAKQQGKTRFIGYSGDSKNALFAVETGRLDALEISINICDQEGLDLVLPKARERDMGVIAKRPIANAVWRFDAKPENGYYQEYWRRLQLLAYPFATGEARARTDAQGPAGVAMRFTAMQPGVHVLIVGTSKPERWRQNVGLLAAGPLAPEFERSIRERWKAVADEGWVGKT